jgi:hypothetical protein
MTDLELTASLGAMKLGVPAVVASDYPFPLGRRALADSPAEVAERVVAFPNVRRLLELPGLPALPGHLDAQNLTEEFAAEATYGATGESYYLFRKGRVPEPGGVEVVGEPGPAMGVVLTAEAEPLDAVDRLYIESRAVRTANMLRGVRARVEGGRLVVEVAPDYRLDPRRLGQTLVAAVRHGFPKIEKVSAEIVFDPARLAGEAGRVRAERAERRAEIEAGTEESVEEFVTCVGCAPFAPDHVCVLTPERHPQCARPYGMIKTGALYGYDDMSNIHHRELHAGMNSFGTSPKGETLDAAAGEYSGINQAVTRLSGGRTTRVQLHSLDTAPHTGCGCFQLIMFKTDKPRPGVGVMDRKYKGEAPDGRSWRDLHYALGGKQAPGMAGAAPNYLRSGKFLAAHGGWKSVVWVSPKIAAIIGEDLPAEVEVGEDTE